MEDLQIFHRKQKITVLEKLQVKMFAKKQSIHQIQANLPSRLRQPFTEEVFNAKHLNHDFFLLVRDQKYKEAFILGQIILKDDANNSAVERFCDFISSNSKDLAKMAEDEKQYTDGSQDEEQQESEEEESQEQDSEDQTSQTSTFRSSCNSISSKASPMSSKSVSDKKISSIKSVGKSASNKQNTHKWEHQCKNPNCPNKNKPHKHK